MWQTSENIIWRENDGVYVILNVSSGNYYTVNETGSLLWEKLIIDGKELNTAVEQICTAFTNSPDKSAVLTECQNLLEEWKSENLIMEKSADE